MRLLLFLGVFCVAFLINSVRSEPSVDENGYIVYCPCMGRFGNQADQFLGALEFAKELQRTLVLPHWVEYPDRSPTSVQIPFDAYFKVEPLQEYTNVILMNDFMKYIAPKVWPEGERTIFCFGPRSNDKKSCAAKEGNPFGPFWDKFGIDFVNDVFYEPLSYDMTYEENREGWKNKYSPDKYPVLAFTGTPGAFPVAAHNVHLHAYLKWSDNIEDKATQFLNRMNKNNEKMIAIHFRNGMDFQRACEHIIEEHAQNFFASPQCVGYHMEKGFLTRDMCYPPEEKIFKQLGETIEKTEAKYVYIAADYDHLIGKLEKHFEGTRFIRYDDHDPHVDLYILGNADHAILNCVSTFSAFAKRERDINERPTDFWAFTLQSHDEL